MDRFQLRAFTDKEAICQATARIIADDCKAAVNERGKFLFVLSGGSTPKRLYEVLAEAPYRDEIDWSKVEILWGDERSVPPDHNDSNYRMANEALISKINIPAEQVHRMEAEREDRDAAAMEYQQKIAQLCGVDASGDPPALDLVLLGMGPDAHTASLFPETEGLRVTDKWVTPNFVPKFDTYRMTFTHPMINQASKVIFLVAGADKADPMFEVYTHPYNPSRLPSQLIRPQGQLNWFADSQAVARLVGGIQGSGENAS